MGCFPVTIPTGPLGPDMLIGCGITHYFVVGEQICMTPEAVVLYNLFSLLLDKDYLRFLAECEDGSMSEAILCLEIVFIDCIVMGDMAIITIGPFPMRAVIPGGILGCHDVAVHAGRRIIRQV